MRIILIGAGGVGDAFERIAVRRDFFEDRRARPGGLPADGARADTWRPHSFFPLSAGAGMWD